MPGGIAVGESIGDRDRTDVSESVLEYDKLDDRDTRRDETDDDRVLATTDVAESLDLVLVPDNGRKKLTVLDLRFPPSSVGFFTSGSLYSNLLYWSEAKYSSPRPKTT
ncbi:Nn.00g045870.m01.CDS01 [Neocucurbitaria sp. VM-36]